MPVSGRTITHRAEYIIKQKEVTVTDKKVYPITAEFKEFVERVGLKGEMIDLMVEMVGEYEHGSADLPSGMRLRYYVGAFEDLLVAMANRN